MSPTSWSATLHLPTTDLPRRAGLTRREPETLQRWSQRDWLAERACDPDRGSPFVLHDGPPYANGPVHLGHVLNKCLKDFVVRFQAMDGRPVAVVRGWDCHGLPVERGVLEQQPALAAASALELRRACRDTALRWQAHQRERFDRLLTLAERRVYRTLDPAYEASVLEVFADLVDQGLVVRALRPVRWSLGNHTALAEAELEFEEVEDPSVWVDFAAAEPAAVHTAFGRTGCEDVALTAWTTTPWTLPANLALAVAPEATYALVRGGGLRVCAAAAVPRLQQALGVALETVATAPGHALVGVSYRPLLGEPPPVADPLRVLAGPHVTTADGSGLVHTAPGFGPEDHQLGRVAGLPPWCPLGPDGRLDDSVPEPLRGLSVAEADEVLPALLRQRGRLAALDTVRHTVAVDWRGGSRVVYRATPQWFVALDRPTRHGGTLRALALEALYDVRFVPATSRHRLEAMLRDRPDWCVSRQRAWGLPLPAFFDSGGRPVLTGDHARSVARCVRAEGSDAWFRRTPSELLGAPSEGLERGGDVLDVWFESGASWAAVLGGRGADLYLEGSDQHRGWFQSSLLLSVAVTGRSPYHTVLTHGFVVDRHGRKLSKSAGNAPDVDQLVERHGAEVLRWWAATSRYEADVKADEALFAEASRAWRKVRDTLRFLVANVGDLPPHEAAPVVASTAPEAWLAVETDRLVETVREAMEAFAFARAARAVHRFCADTLSASYLDAMKDRLYCDRVDSLRRRRAQHAMVRVADVLTRVVAPLLPHTADEVWRALHRCSDDPVASVHAQPLPRPVGHQVDPAWHCLQALRAPAAAALKGWTPLDAGLVLPDPDRVLARLELDDLAAWLGVSQVTRDPGATEVHRVDLSAWPRCERSRRRDGTVRQRAGDVWLSDRDAEAVGLGDSTPHHGG